MNAPRLWQETLASRIWVPKSPLAANRETLAHPPICIGGARVCLSGMGSDSGKAGVLVCFPSFNAAQSETTTEGDNK